MKIDTLGNIAILTEKEIHYFDINLKNPWVLKFDHKLSEGDKFARLEFGKYDGPLFYLISQKSEVVGFDFEN
jgi:hypothetical protein